VKCPKDKNSEMVEAILSGGLYVMHCPVTRGNWIPRIEYDAWLASQWLEPLNLLEIVQRLRTIYYQPPDEDTKAALCPETGHLLVRAKVQTPIPFYIERAGQGGGIWLDYGEWEVLEALGLHTHIDELFSWEWQAAIRQAQLIDRQRQAIIDKLGPSLALQVFELAEALKEDPNGDFGVAYLMQQFDRVSARVN
jgi:Zn-finger nucleic acid-binding protein